MRGYLAHFQAFQLIKVNLVSVYLVVPSIDAAGNSDFTIGCHRRPRHQQVTT